MGPREERWRRALDVLDDASLDIAMKHNDGVKPLITRLRLADALEEALQMHDIAISMLEAAHGQPMPKAQARADSLRAVLAEADGER